MKRTLILMALMLISAAAVAQDNWFFPAQGKVNCYTTTVKSMSGSQTMYSKIRSAAGKNRCVFVDRIPGIRYKCIITFIYKCEKYVRDCFF